MGRIHRERQGPGVSGAGPPGLGGDLPKVKAQRVPPGWAAARLRLGFAFAALQQDRPEMPGAP